MEQRRLVLLAAATLILPPVNGTGCTVCRGGEPITKPDQPILIETTSPLPIDDCAALDAVATYVLAGTPDCEGIRSLGALCGCPVDENACRLCGDQQLPNPHQELGSEAKSILQVDLGETNITCGLYDTLLSAQGHNYDLCLASDPVRTCGCPLLQNTRFSPNNTEILPQCSVCEVWFPDNALRSSSTIPAQTCGDAVAAAKSGILNSTQCNYLQNLLSSHEGSCGGCRQEPVDEDSCSVCPDGFRLRNQTLLLESVVANLTFLLQVADQMFRPDVDGAATCGSMESALEQVPADSNVCMEAQSLDAVCGGCVEVPKSDRGHKEARCTLCPFGEPVPFPNHTIDVDLPVPIADCGTLDLAASVFTADSSDCNELQALAKVCGCSVPASSCSVCPSSPMTRPKSKFAWLRQGNIFASEQSSRTDSYFSCEVLDSALAMSDVSSEECFIIQLRGEACGCSHPLAIAGVLLKRVFATLSFLSVLRDKKKYTSTYHQLVLGISLFDLFNSLSHSFGPLPIPAYSGISAAVGNMTTCKVAAFVIQLGLTSSYFNLGLAAYFWLVICRNKTEDYIRRFRWKFYSAVVVLGVGHALGGIPYYSFGVNTCHIFPPPIAKTWFPAIFFLIGPVAVVMAGATAFTLLVLLEVHRREKASVRYRAEQKRSYHWTRRVFWKSLLYLGAFYLTYPILIATFFVSIDENTAWLLLLTSALGPSQGFWNFVVYYAYNRKSANEKSRKRGCCGGSLDQASPPREIYPSTATQRTKAAVCRHDSTDDMADGWDDGKSEESTRERICDEDRLEVTDDCYALHYHAKLNRKVCDDYGDG